MDYSKRNLADFDLSLRTIRKIEELKIVTVKDLADFNLTNRVSKFAKKTLDECRQFLLSTEYSEETSTFLKTFPQDFVRHKKTFKNKA